MFCPFIPPFRYSSTWGRLALYRLISFLRHLPFLLSLLTSSSQVVSLTFCAPLLSCALLLLLLFSSLNICVWQARGWWQSHSIPPTYFSQFFYTLMVILLTILPLILSPLPRLSSLYSPNLPLLFSLLPPALTFRCSSVHLFIHFTCVPPLRPSPFICSFSRHLLPS